MPKNKVNPIVQWWVTPRLPYNDIYGLPLLIDKSKFAKYRQFVNQWIVHPIKRRLARHYLRTLQKTTDIKVIGITGSAGKTTTKEILYSILKKQYKTVCTQTFIDSVYNIPNTILATPRGTKYLILEMGVEYPGEMDFYLWLAKPDIGVITNIFPTHLKFMESVEGVFNEKNKLVFGLNSGGVAVLNSGDQKLNKLTGKLDSKIVWFKPDENPLTLNANAATATAKSLGMSNEIIKAGILEYKRPAHRLQILKHKTGAMILDDSYNSNPMAALSALAYFNKNARGNKIAVLGDMLELGNYDEQAHRELGHVVGRAGFTHVIGIGKSSKFLIEEVKKNSKNTKTYLFANYGEAVTLVSGLLKKDVSLFVKGSRSLGLDRLIDELS